MSGPTTPTVTPKDRAMSNNDANSTGAQTPDVDRPPAATDVADTTREIVDDPTAIDTLRSQIDALDTALTRLVSERAQLSRRIQAARINAGGTRVELGRERAILDHYRAELGTDGTVLADAVLRVCRGAR